MMVRTGRLEQDKSLQKLIEDNLYALKQYQPRVWFIGNSTLEFGIDVEGLNKELNISGIKLCHGGATGRGSGAMLDLYLHSVSFRPNYVILVITKDDLNPNGLNAKTSKRYLQVMTWRKYLLLNYSYLRSIRGSLYYKISTLWSRVFVKKEDLPSWREKYQIIKLDINQQLVTKKMMENYTFDADGLVFFTKVCHANGLKNIFIILLPITEEYANWHDREFPAMKYQTIRRKLKDECERLGIMLIDLGGPLSNNDLWRDLFHLSPQGSQYVTGLLSQKLSPVIHAER
jgi:hypothetical protein